MSTAIKRQAKVSNASIKRNCLREATVYSAVRRLGSINKRRLASHEKISHSKFEFFFSIGERRRLFGIFFLPSTHYEYSVLASTLNHTKKKHPQKRHQHPKHSIQSVFLSPVIYSVAYRFCSPTPMMPSTFPVSRTLIVLGIVLLPLVSGFRPTENPNSNIQLPSKVVVSKRVASPPIAKEKAKSASAPWSDLMSQFGTLASQKTPVKKEAPKLHADQHRKWGIDQDESMDTDSYWYNERIHTLGNIGFMGAIHAALAPLSTKVIDVLAYNGTDVRLMVAQELAKKVQTSQARVVDLCCGVGMSTRALGKAFPQAETVVGVDTSTEMISMANFLTHHLSIVQPWLSKTNKDGSSPTKEATTTTTSNSFLKSNAEATQLPGRSFDLVTVMYAFHEAPSQGRANMLQEAARLLQPGGRLAVVDISTEYTPSESMLLGEPYVLEYQRNIHHQLRTFSGFAKVTYQTIVPDHVGMWVLQRA